MQVVARRSQRKLALLIALLLCLAAAVAYTATARAAGLPTLFAKPPATMTPPFHQQGQTPIAAADYPQGTDCSGDPTVDLWHFVLPGRDAKFVSLTANYTVLFGVVNIAVIRVFPGPNTTSVQGGKGVNVITPAGALLQSASAITSAPVPFFNLSHTCAGTPQGSPSPSPSLSESANPSPSASATESASPAPSPSGSDGSPSPSVLPTTATRSPSGGTGGGQGGGVLGSGLALTGAPLAWLTLLGLSLLGFGIPLAAAYRRRHTPRHH